MARNIGRALLPKKAENWFLGNQEEEDLLNKYSDDDIPTFDEINENYKSGLYNKDDLINYSNLRNQYEQARANRDYTNVRNANIGQGIVDVGSAAIGGGGAAATKAGVQILRPLLGKKIALQTTQGILGGGLGGVAHGFGTGLVQEDVNPFTQGLIEGGIGAAAGGGIGYGLGKAGQKVAYNNLFKNEGIGLGRILNDDETKFTNYFDDYVSGLKGDPEFITDFSQLPAVGETTPFQKARMDLKLARQGVRPQEATTGEGLFDQYMYHGTPYNETYTDFDLNYLNSGEGANMYGSGVYGAKEADIANRHYRYMGNDQDPIMYNNRPLLDLYDDLERKASRLNPKEAREYYDKMALIEDLEYKGMLDDLDYYSPDIQKWYRNEIEPNITMPGNLYKVRIPDNEFFLDYTKSFNEQSPYVKENLKKYFNLDPAEHTDIDNGHTLYNYITSEFAENNPRRASKLLDEAGIKGSRYIGDRDGEAFVIYNPKNAEIVDTYMGDNKTTQLIRENAYNKYSDAIIKEGNSKNLTDIKVPDEEYARVSKAINSNDYPIEFQNETNFPLTLSNDRIYLIENNGNGNFRIITKKAVNNESTFFDK